MQFVRDGDVLCGRLAIDRIGIRQKRSTQSAVLTLVDHITSIFENGGYGVASFLDLSKAFDCVFHNILLGKLGTYNLHKSSIKLIKSYLDDRSQVVKYKHNISDCLKINQGVPQGSILGPLLFLIFINDLPTSITLDTVLYADDTTLLSKAMTAQSAASINRETQTIIRNWFEQNRLRLNLDKSVNIMFTLNKVTPFPVYEDTTKFLGITVDSKLDWKKRGQEL